MAIRFFCALLLACLLARPVTAEKDTKSSTFRGISFSRQGSCGKASTPQRFSRVLSGESALNRIVGGIEAKAHSIPFIVSLRRLSGGHFCGGTLIRTGSKDESDIIVTAAHCVSR